MTGNPDRLYGEKVAEALAFASEAHVTQTRKGKDTPYLSHVLAVAGLVAHYGGDEEQIIAGALHDAAEDQGGEEMARDIGLRFGPRVEAIVRDCSDALPLPGESKPEWRTRKRAFLATLAQPDRHGSRLVEACDKLANLRDIVEDVERDGPETLARFNGKRTGTLWYYSTLADVLLPQVPRVEPEYRRLLARLLELAGSADSHSPHVDQAGDATDGNPAVAGETGPQGTQFPAAGVDLVP